MFYHDQLLTFADTELKAKIEAFKSERIGRKALPVEQMDTSAG